MGDPGAGQAPSYSATTDFESKSHEELLRMVRDANSERVSQLGQTLVDAGADLDQIGSDLKRDMGALLWEGKAGDAFRAWGHKVAIAAEYLSDYSDTAGRFMKDAGATLADVKSAMPEVPTESKRIADAYAPGMSEEESMAKLGYCPSPEAVTRAKQDTTDAHAEAVRQMTKLGQAYNMSREIISDLEPPEIPPPPTEPMPRGIPRRSDYVPYDQGSATAPDYAFAGSFQGDSGGVPTVSPHPSFLPRQPEEALEPGLPQESHVGVGRDQPVVTDDLHPSPKAPVLTGLDSLAVPPTPHQASDLQPLTQYPVTGEASARPAVPPHSTFGPGMLPSPRGGQAGAGHSEMRRGLGNTPPIPVRSGPSSAPRISPHSGIYGGLPKPVSGPGNQIPRGAVVGGERGTSSAGVRPPMVGGMGQTAGGEPPRSATNGRRLASEPGGVIGTPRRSPGPAGGAFTPGGSGLVGAKRTVSTNRSDSEIRPRRATAHDNETEEGNTWPAGGPRTAPPVIE